MTPWLGSPTSYASGYISAHRTATDSQSLSCAFSSPPTYCTGLATRGSSASRAGNTSAVTSVQGSRAGGGRIDGPSSSPVGPVRTRPVRGTRLRLGGTTFTTTTTTTVVKGQ